MIEEEFDPAFALSSPIYPKGVASSASLSVLNESISSSHTLPDPLSTPSSATGHLYISHGPTVSDSGFVKYATMPSIQIGGMTGGPSGFNWDLPSSRYQRSLYKTVNMEKFREQHRPSEIPFHSSSTIASAVEKCTSGAYTFRQNQA